MKIFDLFRTNDSYAPTFLRIALGVMIVPHGAQKLLGWFGGPGLGATLSFFDNHLHIPPALALLAIIAEFFGGIALILGAVTRLAALSVGITMLVAGIYSLPNGFFMNWFGTQSGEGVEFHLLAIAMATAVLLEGCGMLGVDRLYRRRDERVGSMTLGVSRDLGRPI